MNATHSPKNESTAVFMGRGLRSTGAISPLIVDHRFDEQVRNYPQRELYQTIAMKKFPTNGVKVVDRYNHMKKQIFEFIKTQSSYNKPNAFQRLTANLGNNTYPGGGLLVPV
jgi:hypothetical protein